jgi:hypothetical protein
LNVKFDALTRKVRVWQRCAGSRHPSGRRAEAFDLQARYLFFCLDEDMLGTCKANRINALKAA